MTSIYEKYARFVKAVFRNSACKGTVRPKTGPEAKVTPKPNYVRKTAKVIPKWANMILKYMEFFETSLPFPC